MEVTKIFQTQDFETLDLSKESEPKISWYDDRTVLLMCSDSTP